MFEREGGLGRVCVKLRERERGRTYAESICRFRDGPKDVATEHSATKLPRAHIRPKENFTVLSLSNTHTLSLSLSYFLSLSRSDFFLLTRSLFILAWNP